MARIFREATTIVPLTSMEDGDVAEVGIIQNVLGV